MRSVPVIALLACLTFFQALPSRAEPLPVTPTLIKTDYVDFLNSLYAAGCAVGTVVGVAAGWLMWAGPSPVLLPFAMNGCAIGMVAGPIGMFVHDGVTGDTMVQRYISENW